MLGWDGNIFAEVSAEFSFGFWVENWHGCDRQVNFHEKHACPGFPYHLTSIWYLVRLIVIVLWQLLPTNAYLVSYNLIVWTFLGCPRIRRNSTSNLIIPASVLPHSLWLWKTPQKISGLKTLLDDPSSKHLNYKKEYFKNM